MDIIVLITIIIVLLYIIFNLRRKISKYETMINNYDSMIITISEYLKTSLDRLYTLDANSIFEGDDEVGWFFKSLKELYINLNNNIVEIVNEENTEKK